MSKEIVINLTETDLENLKQKKKIYCDPFITIKIKLIKEYE